MSMTYAAVYTICDDCHRRNVKITCAKSKMCKGYDETCNGDHQCDSCRKAGH